METHDKPVTKVIMFKKDFTIIIYGQKIAINTLFFKVNKNCLELTMAT